MVSVPDLTVSASRGLVHAERGAHSKPRCTSAVPRVVARSVTPRWSDTPDRQLRTGNGWWRFYSMARSLGIQARHAPVPSLSSTEASQKRYPQVKRRGVSLTSLRLKDPMLKETLWHSSQESRRHKYPSLRTPWNTTPHSATPLTGQLSHPPPTPPRPYAATCPSRRRPLPFP